MSEMSRPKWEDLNIDCLVNIFERVGMESLLLDVSFVCKSWYKATLNPQCWRRLVFPKINGSSRLMNAYQQITQVSVGVSITTYRPITDVSVTKFIKFVVKRSERSATDLVLPARCTEEALLFVADECPELSALVLPYDLPHDLMFSIPNLMSKWKSLKFLRLGSSFQMQEVLAQISIHCKNFVALAVTRAYIGKDEASSIATLLPNLKHLVLRHASMEKENLVVILQGCKELVYFDARDCIGFDEGDDEILKLASNIRTFKHEGSIEYEYDDYKLSSRDVDFGDGGCSD